eukprot:5917956-Prymnesium_polylepis.1
MPGAGGGGATRAQQHNARTHQHNARAQRAHLNTRRAATRRSRRRPPSRLSQNAAHRPVDARRRVRRRPGGVTAPVLRGRRRLSRRASGGEPMRRRAERRALPPGWRATRQLGARKKRYTTPHKVEPP